MAVRGVRDSDNEGRMKELFLVCALALPVTNVPINDSGGHNSPGTREAFIREYEWLRDLLEKQYPDNEFLIIPVAYDKTPPDWEWVPFGWDGHLIYKRPLRSAA